MEKIVELAEKYWGFKTLRPLQMEAIASVLKEQDSLVILPTGGGKSLCYQLLAIHLEGCTVVVSPLISHERSGGWTLRWHREGAKCLVNL
jgi:ATP-dependent DNA helicase RecQ